MYIALRSVNFSNRWTDTKELMDVWLTDDHKKLFIL